MGGRMRIDDEQFLNLSVVFGAIKRGIREAGELRQHLSDMYEMPIKEVSSSILTMLMDKGLIIKLTKAVKGSQRGYYYLNEDDLLNELTKKTEPEPEPEPEVKEEASKCTACPPCATCTPQKVQGMTIVPTIGCTQDMDAIEKAGKIPSSIKKWNKHEGKWGMHTYTLLVTSDFYDFVYDTNGDGETVQTIMFDCGNDLLFYYT